jgi:chromosome segregation ATPase
LKALQAGKNQAEEVTRLKSLNANLQSAKSNLVDDKSRLEDQVASLTLANSELIHDKSRLEDQVASLTSQNEAPPSPIWSMTSPEQTRLGHCSEPTI